MRHFIILILVMNSHGLISQDALTAPLPIKISNLEPILYVAHFPARVNVSRDEDQPEKYFWKHTTSVLSVKTVEIIEFGAYIFYNDQWNLRANFSAVEFNEWFGSTDAILKGGEPYTFTKNWRYQSEIIPGWAMWYFIVKDGQGKLSCGYAKLYTSGELLTQENINQQ